MNQFLISVSKEKESWLEGLEKILSVKFRELGGVVATGERLDRVELVLACEKIHRLEAERELKKTLIEMFVTVCKFEYLSLRMGLSGLDSDSRHILLHTLVAFDRETEGEIVAKKLKIQRGLALDGFFNFRLVELKTRWDEIISLASSNSLYLTSSHTLDELLKFLLSAISPKVKKLTIKNKKGHFEVLGRLNDKSFELKMVSSRQLLAYLINVAPLELTLEGEFVDKDLYGRIVSIFDGSSK